MKKLFVFVVTLVICSCAFAQNKDVKVILKNGSVLVGQLKSMDPSKSAIIIIGSNDIEIKMSDVDKIENASLNSTDEKDGKGNIKYLQTDKKPYPESVDIKIGEQTITMLLVRGGYFMMGFDGRHSLSFDSEPVHKVNVSSFYISKGDISHYVYKYIMGNEHPKNNDRVAKMSNTGADKFIKKLCKFTGKPYRINTETQWEYAARSPLQHKIFTENMNWASDYFKTYPDCEQTDPQGPSKGLRQVIRKYDDSEKKFDRSKSSYASGPNQAAMHIVISAEEI